MDDTYSSLSESERDEILPNPKRLKTLASNVQTSGGNFVLHQFVLDHSNSNDVRNEAYINAVLLSMHDVEVNDYNDEGYSALHLAVLKNSVFMVKKLLSCLKNIDINNICNFIGTPTTLHLAIICGHLAIVKELLHHGADVNKIDGYRCTPLSKAEVKCNADIIKLLLDKGANINEKYDGGKTVLYQAAMGGSSLEFHFGVGGAIYDDRSDIINLLLNEGADVNAKEDEYHYTPLHIAVQFRYYNAVKLLLESGADVNAVDKYNYTPLLYAAGSCHIGIVKLLLASGADVNAKNNKSYYPIHYAAESGCLDVIILFLDSGADVNAKNKDGCTPVHRSAKNETTSFMGRWRRWSGRLDVIKVLLERGADVHASDNSNCTPLHFAVKSGEIDIIALLLHNGADVNAKNKDGYSPLHYSVEISNVDIVKYLLERGADVNAKNEDNKTPVDLAKENNRQSCVEALQNVI